MEQSRLHESLNRSVYGSGIPLKVFASALDVSISELCRMLSSENSLRFPHDGVAVVMKIANNYDYLDTLADQAGREVRLKEVSPTELTQNLIEAINELPEKLGQAMEAIQNGS